MKWLGFREKAREGEPIHLFSINWLYPLNDIFRALGLLSCREVCEFRKLFGDNGMLIGDMRIY
jgi:hypothetical protein